MESRGYFQYKQEGEDISDVQCPELSSRGCCCACEYVDDYDEYLNSINQGVPSYMGGLQDDVTFCECHSIGGIWLGKDRLCSEINESSDDIFAFCTNGASNNPKVPDPIEDDVRFPSGCCVEVGGNVFDCYNVCSESECSNQQTKINPNGIATYYPTVSCPFDPTVEIQIECGSTPYRSETTEGGNSVRSKVYDNVLISSVPTERDSIIRYNNTVNSKDGLFSACVQEDKCTETVVGNCNGYWMGLKKQGIPYNCSDSSEINVVNDFIKYGTVSSSVANSWTPGSYQLGGFYVGQFWSSGSPFERLQGYGNPKTGIAEKYVMESDGKEFKSFLKNKYAVIVSPRDLHATNIKFHEKSISLNTKIPISSKFDSARNMNADFDIINTVKHSCVDNGITSSNINSCIIPSLHLSAFIYDKTKNDSNFMDGILKNSNPAYKWQPMTSTYWTSTIVNESDKNRKMTYTQNFNSGFVSACDWDMMHRVRTVTLARIV